MHLDILPKMLSQKLKALEQNKIITRKLYDTMLNPRFFVNFNNLKIILLITVILNFLLRILNFTTILFSSHKSVYKPTTFIILNAQFAICNSKLLPHNSIYSFLPLQPQNNIRINHGRYTGSITGGSDKICRR